MHIKHDPNTGFLNVMQNNLIKRVLETLGLNVGTANGKFNHAEGKPLAKHVHGEPAIGDFNYSSVVGMLLCLAGQTRPDITFAVNCVQDICSAQSWCINKPSSHLAII